jgi:hypothetical protein
VGRIADLLLGNYKTVSAQLGLTIDGGVTQDHLMIHGTVDEVTVEMWFGNHATHTRARLPHHAPIALRIATRGWLARLFGRRSDLGAPDVDRRFSLTAEDRHRVAMLLTDDARGVLLEIAKLRLHPIVEQDQVRLRMFSNGGGDKPEKIVRELRETARLARSIDACFAR